MGPIAGLEEVEGGGKRLPSLGKRGRLDESEVADRTAGEGNGVTCA